MKVAVLGGGQLGQMLAQAARHLDISCRFLDSSPSACAGSEGEVVVAAFTDEAAIAALCDWADAGTCEFESVPLQSLEAMARSVRVAPGPRSFGAARHRREEKRAFEAVGWPTSPWIAIDGPEDFERAQEIGFPGVLKRNEGGYDGTGLVFVDGPGELPAAFDAMGAGCIYERRVEFVRELSIIACRGEDGAVVVWDLVENVHHHGVLQSSICPAPNARPGMVARAIELVEGLAHHLGHVGVLTVEMFETASGIVANEMAPRVHNSGHLTIETHTVSQFENHMRAVVGLALVEPVGRGTGVMVNLLGDLPSAPLPTSEGDGAVHIYGKQPGRPRRKLGHVTVVRRTIDEAVSARSRLVEWAGA